MTGCDAPARGRWCGRHFRLSTLTFSRADGGYRCPLCVLDDRDTIVDLDRKQEHVREDHGVDPDDKMAVIREKRRLIAEGDRPEEQVGFGDY